jgi:hypothetical protein
LGLHARITADPMSAPWHWPPALMPSRSLPADLA